MQKIESRKPSARVGHAGGMATERSDISTYHDTLFGAPCQAVAQVLGPAYLVARLRGLETLADDLLELARLWIRRRRGGGR